MTGVVIAVSSGQAKRAMLRSANDAGYTFDWTEMRCKRAPSCDQLVSTLKINTPYAVGDEDEEAQP